MLSAEDLLANPALLSQLGDLDKPLVQNLAPGPFDFSHLRWSEELRFPQAGVQQVRQAFIPTDRLSDLCRGLLPHLADFSLLSDTKKNRTLSRPKADSWLQTTRYYCCFGPEDLRQTVTQIPDPASRPAQGLGSRRPHIALGGSIKRGCQFSFAAKTTLQVAGCHRNHHLL